MMQNLHHLIKIGMYVTFLWEGNICCGRITNACTLREDKIVVTVNEYLRQSKLEEELGSTLLPFPIANRFISVEELFWTSRFRNIYSNSLHGVIFIYPPSTIMKLGYEGSQHIFCLRYELDARRSISPVKEKNAYHFLANTKYFQLFTQATVSD